MNRFQARWPTDHVVLPVIHATSSSRQVLHNVDLAVEAGADGVWLVNHSIAHGALLATHSIVMHHHPTLWVGVNSLGANLPWVNAHPHVQGMWADNACIDERVFEQPIAERAYQNMRERWQGIYFGGVAFKGQRKVKPEMYGEAARKAMPFMDVVTTSGPGTGEAADVDKIRAMRAALGDFPLAIASGITPDNVSQYLPYADCFLVASGISDDFENLNLGLTRALIKNVREWDTTV